jgi:hypothetical protein
MMKRWQTKHLVAEQDAQHTMKRVMMKIWRTKHLVAEQGAQATGMVTMMTTIDESTQAGRMDRQAVVTTRQRKMRRTMRLTSAIFCRGHLVHIGNTGAGVPIPVKAAAMTTRKG